MVLPLPASPFPGAGGELPGPGLKGPQHFTLQWDQRLEGVAGAADTTLAQASLSHCHISKPCQVPTDTVC